MGKVASGIGKALKHVAAAGTSIITGGAVDLNKMRINVPLSSGAVRSFAGNHAKALTLGLLDKPIDSVLGTKEAKTAGTAIGAAIGAGTGLGLASSALGAGSVAASAAGSASGTAAAGLAPGALTAGVAGSGGGGSVLSTLGAIAPLAAGVPALMNAGKKAPSAPDINAGPTPDEIAKQLEQDRASAESQARTDRARKVAGSFRKKGLGEEDLTTALVENRTASRSVLGGF